ncbi:MAG: M20 family metallopeptidase [Flavobacteriales bacterium]
MELKDKIKNLAAEFAAEMIAVRRHLHMHPELSYQEKETSKFIQSKLNEMGIPFQAGVGGEGVVATLEGQKEGSVFIALRADMDALPIHENNKVEYCSTVPGVMHACGHDVHTACLLGAAKILKSLEKDWGGTITLVFQPAEEKLPGGASLMLKDGLFAKQKPERMFGQHVYPELEAGKIGVASGPYMASADEIYVTIKGKGGHGAKPDRTIDPVLIASNLVVSLQQVVSRWANPITPSVLSFGKFIAEGATNVIPSEVRLEGTFRTFDEKWRFEAHARMKKLAESLVEGMGGTIDFDIHVGYPVVNNNPDVAAKTKQAAISFLGENNVVDLEKRATAEDFAYYTQVIPSCFYRLGTAGEDGSFSHSVHHPQFDINEKAIETGMGFMAYLAIY